MAQKPLVYLAGPITGLSYKECVSWREDMTTSCSHAFDFLSPMRNKQFLQSKKTIENTPDLEDHLETSQRGIFARDMTDVSRCDVLFVNLLNTKKVSIGTIVEITTAYHQKTPIILVTDPDNIHTHPFIKEMCPFTVHNMEDGIDLLFNLFGC